MRTSLREGGALVKVYHAGRIPDQSKHSVLLGKIGREYFGEYFPLLLPKREDIELGVAFALIDLPGCLETALVFSFEATIICAINALFWISTIVCAGIAGNCVPSCFSPPTGFGNFLMSACRTISLLDLSPSGSPFEPAARHLTPCQYRTRGRVMNSFRYYWHIA